MNIIPLPTLQENWPEVSSAVTGPDPQPAAFIYLSYLARAGGEFRQFFSSL